METDKKKSLIVSQLMYFSGRYNTKDGMRGYMDCVKFTIETLSCDIYEKLELFTFLEQKLGEMFED